MDALKVFVSSTWHDLLLERAAVEKALHGLRSTRFVGMEYFGTQDRSTRNVSLDEVDSCDIYVGIIGHRYGSGITEQEYRRALQSRLHCLIYLKAGAPLQKVGSPDDLRRVENLRSELQQKHTVCFFNTPEELAMRIVADLHNAVFDRLVVQGIGILRSDYDARIQRFLTEYLGDGRRPIAFGGRDQELARLDEWLESASGPSYAVLAGPAGRGKSALLVHWARRVSRENEVALIFFPVSIRFRTNLASVVYASITARLAALHGEPVPGAVDTPPEIWRALMSGYLARNLPNGRRLLVILDGVDEGADWHADELLFPSSPPSGLRVLVSARYLAGDVDSGGWIKRLGWSQLGLADAIDLAPLNPQGLVEVLRRMSVPLDLLSGRSDVVAELFRLTQGDPLLVNLYIADLWARGEKVARLKPTDLAELAPGLEGFFLRWWEDQRALWGVQSPLREPAVNAVLNTLSCALGPLLSEELLQLLPSDCGISLWALDEVVHLLERFVIGDGDTQGYALSHPRLADYFYERLAKAKQAERQEACFISWGLDHLKSLDEVGHIVPTYILQFMRRHMERCKSVVASFLVLTSKGWISAWERLDRGSYAGFLNDLTHVRQIVMQENDACARRGELSSFVAAELRCALCMSSIASLAGDMSVSAMLALIRKEIWSPAQAIAYAANISIASNRLSVLFELTGRIDATHRPLALAALLAETRRLLTTSEGRSILEEVILALLAASARTGSVSITASVVEAVYGVAEQLEEPERACCLQALGSGKSRLPPEHFAAASFTLATHLVPSEASDERHRVMSVLRELAIRPQDLRPALVGDRLLLLRDAIVAEGPAVPEPLMIAGLRTAIEVVALLASLPGEAHDGLVEAGLSCLQQLTPQDRLRGMARLAPFLAPRHFNILLTEGLVGMAPDDRLRALVKCLLGVAPGVQTQVIEVLKQQVVSGHCSSTALLEQLGFAAKRLSTEDVIHWLDRGCANIEPENVLHACCRISQALKPSAAQAELSKRLLLALRRPMRPQVLLDALIGLIDYSASPGTQDSFEEWRPLPEQRTLAFPVFRLLSDAAAPVKDVVNTIAFLVDNGYLKECPRATQVSLALLGAARSEVQPLSLPQSAADAASASIAQQLLQIVDEHQQPTDIDSEGIQNLTRKFGALPTLAAMAQIAPRLRGDVQQIVAREILDGVDAEPSVDDICAMLAVMAAQRLFSPGSDLVNAVIGLAHRHLGAAFDGALRRILLPDKVRQEFLLLRLQALVNESVTQQDYSVPELLLDVGMLASPSDQLLGLALTALGQVAEVPHPTSSSLTSKILNRLMPRLTPLVLPRFLGCFDGMDVHQRRLLLGVLKDQRCKHITTHWREIVEAVGRLPNARQRAIWVMSMAPLVGDDAEIDPSCMLSGVEQDAERFYLLCALIPVTQPPEQRRLLLDALELAQREAMPASYGRALVQITADRYGADATLMKRAAATAVALSDPKLRGDALAELAERLTPDEMVRAATALRRLNDAPARVRAMCALAQAITDVPGRCRVAERIWGSIQTLDGATQAAAKLYAVRFLPEAVKWTALASSFSRLGRDGGGFERSELLNAVADVLVDAPARLYQGALSWMLKLPREQRRAETLLTMFPRLPVWLQVPALGMLAQNIDQSNGLGRIAIHVADSILAEFQESWSSPEGSFSPEVKKILHAIVKLRTEAEAPSVEGPVSTRDWDERVATRLTSGGEVRRASIVKFMALHPQLGPRWRAELIAVTSQICDDETRASAARYLSVLETDELLDSAICAVRGIESFADRAAALTMLARRRAGPARESLLDEALDYVRAEPDQFSRVQAAIDLATNAPTRLPDCLKMIPTAGVSDADANALARAMRELIGRLPDENAGMAVTYLQNIEDERLRLRIMLEVAPKLGRSAAALALDLTRRLASAVDRSRVLCCLVPRLREQDLMACESVLDGIGTDFAWLEALAAMTLRWGSACLTPDRAAKACTTLTEIDDDKFVATCVQRMAFAWPDAYQSLLLRALRRLTRATWRCEALSALASHCHSIDWQTLEAEMRSIDDPFHRSVALGHLASLCHPLNCALLEEALCMARQSRGRQRYIDAIVLMAAITQSLADPLLESLLDEYDRLPLLVISALTTVGCWMTPMQAAVVTHRLNRWRAGAYGTESAELFRELAQRLDAELLPVLIEHTSRICSERVTSAFLNDIAPLLNDDASAAAAFAVATRMRSEKYRVESLAGLLICFDERVQAETVLMLTNVVSEHERFRRLIHLVPDLKPVVRHKLSADHALLSTHSEYAKRLAAAITRADKGEQGWESDAISPPPGADDEAWRETTFKVLVEEAAGRRSRSDVEQVREVEHDFGCRGGATIALSKLYRKIEADRFDDAIRCLGRLSRTERDVLILHLPGLLHENRLADALVASLRLSPPPDMNAVFGAMRHLEDDRNVQRVLACVGSRVEDDALSVVNGYFREELMAGSHQERKSFLQRVSLLTPLIGRLGGDSALAEAVEAISDVGALWP